MSSSSLDTCEKIRQNIKAMILKLLTLMIFLTVLTQGNCSGVIIEIKFADDAGYHMINNALYCAGNRLVNLHQLSVNIDIQPVFQRCHTRLEADRQRAASIANRTMPDLTQYFHVYVPETDLQKVVSRLAIKKDIEQIFILPDHAVPASVNDETPDFSIHQEYLFDEAGPQLARAWTYPGGRGDGVTVALIESNCNRFHEDLVHRLGAPDTVIGGVPGGGTGAKDHGTAVAGMLIAGNNGFGITGICHQAAMRLYFASSPEVLANAIDVTQASINEGDIILIQLQVPGPLHPGGDSQYGMVPVDYIPSVFDAISLANTLEKIVVIPAGNGSQNLDDPVYQGAFDPDTRDSGAIVVGAGRPADRAPVAYTNYGSRVNLQGWAERMNPCCQVWTTGYGNAPGSPAEPNRTYTDRFSGTSSAAAMVAGAAACLQGAAQYRAAHKLTPSEIRSILITTGYDQTGTRHIGPLPGIVNAIESIPIAGITTELILNMQSFTSFDPFHLSLETVNPREQRAVIKFLALQCLTEWFFLDCNLNMFVPYVQGCPELLLPGTHHETLLSFTWPKGDFGRFNPGEGISFFVVYTDMFDGSLASNLHEIPFGWY